MNVVFCHNVFNRLATLYDTVKLDKQHFPEYHVVIGYNNVNPRETLKEFSNVHVIYYHGFTHKIGCTNGFISTVKTALKYEPDVIIFSHDDVYISDVNVVISNIDLIQNENIDVICRKPHSSSAIGNEYYMMECLYLSKRAGEIVDSLELFKEESEIPRDIVGSISPEVFLFNLFKDKGLNIIDHTYNANAPIGDYNKLLTESLGYFHKNIGVRGWNDLYISGYSLL